MGIIRVTGIHLHANHGCMEEEALIGGEYRVDVVLHTDFSEAAATDDLTKTIDYVTVNQIVEEEMAVRSKLIEHVGQRIVARLKSTFDTLETVALTVTKISPPINGNVENVSITIEA